MTDLGLNVHRFNQILVYVGSQVTMVNEGDWYTVMKPFQRRKNHSKHSVATAGNLAFQPVTCFSAVRDFSESNFATSSAKVGQLSAIVKWHSN